MTMTFERIEKAAKVFGWALRILAIVAVVVLAAMAVDSVGGFR